MGSDCTVHAFPFLRYRDSIAGRDFEKLLSESGMVKEEMDDDDALDDLGDLDYKHHPYTTTATAATKEENLDLDNDAFKEDGASIVIAPEAPGAPSDLPVSVNIEVNFQDGKVTVVAGECVLNNNSFLKTVLNTVPVTRYFSF